MKIIPAEGLNTEENKHHPDRLKHKDLIDRRLNEIFAMNTQKYWLDKLQAARIPYAPINTMQQALNDDQVLFRNMVVVEVEYPLGGSTKVPGKPIKLSDTYEDTFSPPPLLGQHNQEIYAALGMTREKIETLQNIGVI